MSTVQVIVDPATFRLDQGVVTGGLWLAVDGQAFPEADWNDFPLVVLGWWAEAVADLLNGGPSRELLFMDGPYLAATAATDSGRCAIRFLRGDEVKAATSDLDMALLAQQVEIAGREVERFCRSQDHNDRDVVVLGANLERLRVT